MKRILTLLASLALVASGLHILPAAAAEEAPEIPATVQIEDPADDGNFLNDQGNRGDIGFQGDNATPADGSTVGDMLKVWFTNDAENVSVNFQTQAPGPAATTIVYQAYTNAGEGATGSNALGCLRWYLLIPGAYSGQATTYQGPPVIKLVDRCNDEGTSVYSNGVEGKYTIAEGPDGTGILTATFPRSYSPLLAGPALTAPFASTSIAAGAEAAGNVSLLMIDNTANGTDYAFVEGGSNTTPSGKNPIPGKKKGCDNGKGKKRGCEGPGKKSPKPGKPAGACTPVAPATAGKDAPALTLTDAATAEKPAVQTLTLEQRFDEGLGDALGVPGSSPAAPSSVNVTVDTAAKGPIGLYATLEFPARRDYDLWAYFPGTENEEAASSHGFSPLIETQGQGPADVSNTASNHGGETTANSENLVGILTPDCGGYTITAYNYFGEGGDLDLKLWLGEAKYDPAETPSEGAAATMRASYDTVMTLF